LQHQYRAGVRSVRHWLALKTTSAISALHVALKCVKLAIGCHALGLIKVRAAEWGNFTFEVPVQKAQSSALRAVAFECARS
jgi:hypothetical protein